VANKVMIVTDMLNDFLQVGGALDVGEAGRRVIPYIAAELKKARTLGYPVLYLCDRHLTGDREFEMFPPHCLAGSAGGDICRELSPKDGELVLYKRRYSGFFGTDLDITLREQGIESLVLVGVCTNICVLYTVADARNLGYRVTVLKDGVASFDSQAHLFALQEMEKTLGATVV